MASDPWMTHPTLSSLEVLRIPAQAQPDQEPKCLPYCMWMVLRYFEEWYPIDWVRDEVTTIPADKFDQFLTIRDSGWVPDNPEKEFERLSEVTNPVRFVHRFWESSPPSTVFFDMLSTKLERDIPTIAIIDHRALHEGNPSTGAVHAVVVTGVGEAKVSVNDPWGRQHEIFNKPEFYDAWDAQRINQLVRVDVIEQSTLQSPLPTENQP